MLPSHIREQIASLIKQEVVPAVGCTEPAAVALCAARCRRHLNARPAHIQVWLSGNMLKNAMGVGIPGTGGMIGAPVAVALGALAGHDELELEVLAKITPDDVQAAKQFIHDGHLEINLKDPCCDILYIEVVCRADDGRASRAIISGSHTHFAFLGDADTPVSSDLQPHSNAAGSCASPTPAAANSPKLSLRTVWEFATESPIDELRFILEARRMNRYVAEQAFIGHYGHEVGRTLHSDRQRSMMGDSVFSRMLSYTTAACDARMAGAPLPVMSNSGSGNQGIVATLPVAVYADEIFSDEETTVRALALSHLTVIYIKQHLGRLSALCGCVVAATGSACAIAYLMGGKFPQIAATAKNMVGNLTGMICDGAKPGCAMKVASGVSTAVMSAILAMENHCVSADEGIVDDEVDCSIANLARVGRDGMVATDRLILEIMTSKHHPQNV